MNKSQDLAARFRELYLNGKWIANTNYKDQIMSTGWQEANQRIGSLNTVALLTFHINYYIEGVLEVFEGRKLLIQDKFSFDCPPIQNEEDWHKLRQSFINNAEQMARHIESLSKEQLEATFEKEAYGSYERNIEGLIEHGYYHLGQISLIRKLIADKT